MSDPTPDGGEFVEVWFDGNSVVDGHVAVFGPRNQSLSVGQKVLANMENEAMYEAVVTIATPMDDRDIATVRLGDEVPDFRGAR